jgi:uncharacterized protein YndB with AHSA1/START domain
MIFKGGDNEQDQVLLIERTYDAPPAQVFAAWTDPALLKQWWGPPGSVVEVAEVDLRVGGRYRLGIRRGPHSTYYVSGVYQIVQPPHKLVFTWRWENANTDLGRSLVTIELYAHGDKTNLRLTHEQLPTEEARQSHAEGWIGILVELHNFLAR